MCVSGGQHVFFTAQREIQIQLYCRGIKNVKREACQRRAGRIGEGLKWKETGSLKSTANKNSTACLPFDLTSPSGGYFANNAFFH